jgi:hypothetical protein
MRKSSYAAHNRPAVAVTVEPTLYASRLERWIWSELTPIAELYHAVDTGAWDVAGDPCLRNAIRLRPVERARVRQRLIERVGAAEGGQVKIGPVLLQSRGGSLTVRLG